VFGQETWYHAISEGDMEVVMEYNCDYRRYTRPTWSQHSEKKPVFYRRAESAVQNFGSDRVALVAVKVATISNSSLLNNCCKDWDTEYYPDYMVVLR
jgi:hypothetical protein